MINGLLSDLKYMTGLGGLLFIAGLIISEAIIFITGFFLIGLSFIIETNTASAYNNAKSKR